MKKKILKRKRKNPSELEILKQWIKNQIDRNDLSYDEYTFILDGWEPGNANRLTVDDEYFEKIFLNRKDHKLSINYKKSKKLPYIIIQYDDYGNMTLGTDVEYWLSK